MLIIFMVKSGEALDYVVDCLLKDKAIKSSNGGPSLPRQKRRAVSPLGYTKDLNSFDNAVKKNNTPQN